MTYSISVVTVPDFDTPLGRWLYAKGWPVVEGNKNIIWLMETHEPEFRAPMVKLHNLDELHQIMAETGHAIMIRNNTPLLTGVSADYNILIVNDYMG